MALLIDTRPVGGGNHKTFAALQHGPSMLVHDGLGFPTNMDLPTRNLAGALHMFYCGHEKGYPQCPNIPYFTWTYPALSLCQAQESARSPGNVFFRSLTCECCHTSSSQTESAQTATSTVVSSHFSGLPSQQTDHRQGIDLTNVSHWRHVETTRNSSDLPADFRSRTSTPRGQLLG